MSTTSLVMFLVLIALATKPMFGAADASPEPVRDVTGKKLRAGIHYYISSIIFGAGGGGLTLGRGRNKTCPYDVVQEKSDLRKGRPLTFTPVNSTKGVIRVSTDLNIKFFAATICVQSNVWKLDHYDESTKQWFVTTGGVAGNPGCQTTSNWFKIVSVNKVHHFYKLMFCPSVCDYGKVLCKDVGIYPDKDGKRRLALSDHPFIILFKKI